MVGSDYNATWWGWGAIFIPPRISEATEQIYQIQTAFDSHVKTAEEKLILLTSGSLMTSQVRSKVNCSQSTDVLWNAL